MASSPTARPKSGTPTGSTGQTPTPPVGQTPTPTPSPTVAVTPTPINVQANSVTAVATGISGAIGSKYVASQKRLYFVEFAGNLSVINFSGGNPAYSVLGTGYNEPEDIYVTADGQTAYITERGNGSAGTGDLVRVDLHNPNRSSATVIASNLNAPQQLAVDETNNVAYTVEFANPGRFLKIDLNNGAITPLLSNLQQGIGLLMTSDFNTAYITQQLSDGSGTLSSYNLQTGTSLQQLASTTAPLFFLSWTNSTMTALLVTERDPADKVLYIDLSQTPTKLQLVASFTGGSQPSSVSLMSSSNLFPLLVTGNTEVDQASQ